MSGPRQLLHAGDQGVFVGPVQRIARLESDDSFPAALVEQGPRLARRQHELAILGMFRLRQYAHLATKEHVARIFERHPAAGMIGAFRAVDALQVAKFFERKDVVDLQRADDFVLAVGQSDRLADLERSGQALVDRKADRNGPGVFLAVLDDDFLVEHPIEGCLVHGPDERTEAAVAEAIEARQIGVADRHLFERRGLAAKVNSLGQRHHAIYRFASASVRRNQVRHDNGLPNKRNYHAAG